MLLPFFHFKCRLAPTKNMLFYCFSEICGFDALKNLTRLDIVLKYQPQSPYCINLKYFEEVSGSNGPLGAMDPLLFLTNWWELDEKSLTFTTQSILNGGQPFHPFSGGLSALFLQQLLHGSLWGWVLPTQGQGLAFWKCAPWIFPSVELGPI